MSNARDEARAAYGDILDAYLLFQEWKQVIAKTEGFSITPREVIYAFEIDRNPGQPVSYYSKKAYVTPGTYTAVRKSLAAKGLIDVYPDPKDARVKRVRLTERGQTTISRHLDYFSLLQEIVVSKLGERSRDEFLRLLREATSIMRERRNAFKPRK